MQNLDKLKQKDNITEETSEQTIQIKEPLSTLPSNSLEQDFEKINSAIEDVKKKNNLASDEQTSTEYKNNNSTNTSNLSREKIAALKTAERYNKLLYLSKKRLYSQLTSESGEKFRSEAAQYAIDNI
ncbi:Ltp family lipoprotein [Staphylococcus simulans]|uniref:Ltp family lipoprotein n=1 Tax=Staphylococcus simulans TaxID=1286 RepID=UPI000D023A2A|nr:Ltp family lipoprotein [Staphylococcus simulans]